MEIRQPRSFAAVTGDLRFAIISCGMMVAGGIGKVVGGPDRLAGARRLALGVAGLPFFFSVAVVETALLVRHGAKGARKVQVHS